METHSKKTSLFSKIARRVKRKVRQLSKLPIIYSYKDFSIKLPSNHLLPEYQKTHPKYDRFLPHLAKYATAVDLENQGSDITENYLASQLTQVGEDLFYLPENAGIYNEMGG